jgi:hypothetical protein
MKPTETAVELEILGRTRNLTGGISVRRLLASAARANGRPVHLLGSHRTAADGSQIRIERAKDDWQNRRFLTVPGDELAFMPLPDSGV